MLIMVLQTHNSREDGQTQGTQKLFAYSKHSLIAEQYIFWLYHGERVRGEVETIFENKEMFGKVVNVLRSCYVIHTFF